MGAVNRIESDGLEWPAVPLEALAEKLQDGPFGSNLKSAHYVESGVRVVRLQNIAVGHFDDADRAYVSPEHFEKLRKHKCSPGDVLVATLGDPILRAAVLPDSITVALNKADCIQLRCNSDVATPEYVTHYLNSRRAQAHAAALAHGQTRPRINLSHLRELPIPLPPIGEQRRIAAVLDAADALRIKRRRAIVKLDTLTQAIFIDMFGDPVVNPRGWTVVKAASVTSKIGSGATPRGGSKSYKDEGISLIRSMNVYDRRFVRDGLAFIDTDQASALENVTVEIDDVLLNITGASVARVCRVPEEVLPGRVNQHVAIVRPKPELMRPTFLAHVLVAPSSKAVLMRIAEKGATRQAITKAEIEELDLICPPIDHQMRFEQATRPLADVAERGAASAQKLETLFASLQQRAFRGDL